MRAVSLSNPKVISELNARYVSVFASNEDFTDSGPASKDEKAELRRIQREGLAKGLSVGSVHAYVIAPDGSVRDSLHTVQAAKADILLAMLQRNSSALNIAAGPPVVTPTPQPPPACSPGETRLSLIARYLQKSGDDFVPIQSDSGDWSSLPSEDWIVLAAEERSKLAPPGSLKVGSSWVVPASVANKLLTHFYPPTENWETDKNVIRESSLKARVDSVAGNEAMVTLSGNLNMEHWFYHKPDGKYVEADIAGYAVTEVKTGKLKQLSLVTTRADYRGAGQNLPFGVAVRLVP
jgi:hypothetical protein